MLVLLKLIATKKKEETKEDETETVEEELIQTEESSSEQSIEDEETDNKIIIDIQNTEIYINNVKIVYENTDDLEGKLKKELESMVSDKSEVYMKSQDGNYDLHEKIEGILNELGIKWVEVMESTE